MSLPADEDDVAGNSAECDVYQPLQADRQEIRVTVLNPGRFEDPLEWCLRTVSLDESHDYEALSYVWGDAPVKSHSIAVGDAGTLSITANLDSALRHLRLSEGSRDVRVDALCINQIDDKERNQQVAQMGKAFGSALCVKVWFGGLDNIKDLAVEMIEAGAKNSSLHWFPTDEPCMDAKFLETSFPIAVLGA